MKEFFSKPLSKLRLSVSARLTLWYGASVVLLLGLFGTYLYVSFHVGLHRDLAAALEREKTHLLRTAGSQAAGGASRLDLTHHHATGPETYVRVISTGGRVEAQSANFQGRDGLALALPKASAEETITRHWGEAHARSLYAPLRGSTGTLSGWVEVTRLESDLHRELHRLAWLLVLGGLLGTGVALAAGYGLARRALRPVSRLTQAARQIQREGFGRRLRTREGAARDELTDLADAFNDMLARLEASFERERRFRADAAHELMTPLSAMQSEAEVTLRKQREPAGYEESLRRILERSQGMSALVEQLLRLSRLESDASEHEGQAHPHAVNLSEVAREAVGRAQRRAAERDQVLTTRIEDEAWVPVSEEDLTAVLENLLSNALKYTPAGGTIRCIVGRKSVSHRGNGTALLRVEDSGVGFEEDGAVLFERFRRSTIVQTQDQPGTGLGLAIVRAVAEAHGGRVRARSEGRGRGSVFEVALPLSTAASLSQEHDEA